MKQPNYFRIVVAGLIDAALAILFVLALFRYLPDEVIDKITINNRADWIVYLVFIIYRFITITFFKNTLGMKMLKLIFLNYEEEELNLKEKLLASIFILYEGVDYYKMS